MNIETLTKNNINKADKSELLGLFKEIQAWSERRKLDKAFQHQLSLRGHSAPNDAQREVGKMSSLAHRIKTRLIYEFDCTGMIGEKL